jgi:hypothetical protein
MTMIEPDGSMIGSDEVKAMVEGAHGKRSTDFEIRVDVIEARQIGEDTALVIYDEHQMIDGQKSVATLVRLVQSGPGCARGRCLAAAAGNMDYERINQSGRERPDNKESENEHDQDIRPCGLGPALRQCARFASL